MQPNQHRDTLAVGDLAVGLDRVRQGVGKYPPETSELLIWLHGYACQVLRTRQRLTGALGYDWSVVIRVWDGKYEGNIPAFLESVARLKRQADRTRGSEFIDTQVTRRIMAACDRARDYGDVVLITGPTGRGKTLTLKEWQALNNHGRALYLDLPVPATRRTLTDELSTLLGYRNRRWRKAHQSQSAIEDSLDSSNILIIDEATRLLPSGRSGNFSAAEFLRRLHDVLGCGLVLSATNLFKAEMEAGVHQRYFEQLFGRIEELVDIPKEVSLSEVREICQRFEPKATGELITSVRHYANAGRGGLRTCVRLLRQARGLSDDDRQPLSKDYWAAAVELREKNHAWDD